jgi:hypothetical protein
MRLAKETGGCSIIWHGKSYAWKTDGAVIQVPDEFGAELLAIRGADYSEVLPEPEPTPVTEPAPVPKAAVTEPAPAPKAPAAEAPAKGAAAK